MIGQTNQSNESLGSRSDLWKRVYVRARERWPTRASVRSFVIGKTNSRIENHHSLRGDLASDKWAIGARWHVARNCGDASRSQRSTNTIYKIYVAPRHIKEESLPAVATCITANCMFYFTQCGHLSVNFKVELKICFYRKPYIIFL